MTLLIPAYEPADRHSSHFRTVRDSLRVYGRILRFGASSLVAAALDYGLLFGLKALTGSLLASVVLARVASASANYALNRSLVFHADRGAASIPRTLPRYVALAALILALNYGMLSLLTAVAGLPLLPAKLVAEAVLYLLSYWIQRTFVFAFPAEALPEAKR